MNVEPIVSIIIPCYNYGRFISDTIASVERCDSSLYELIIINDGSTDPHTRQVLKDLDKSGYHVIEQENKGVSAARNTGIAAARGKYILPLDADDEIYPSYLPSAISLMEENADVGVVYGQAELFGAEQGEWKLPGAGFDVKRLLIFNYIYVSALFRKDIWKECGGFDLDSRVDGWEDWDFWISVAEKGWKFTQLDELVFRYRIHESSKMYLHRIKDKVPSAIQEFIMCKHAGFYRKHFIDMYDETARLNHWQRRPLRGIARLSLMQIKALLNYKR